MRIARLPFFVAWLAASWACDDAPRAVPEPNADRTAGPPPAPARPEIVKAEAPTSGRAWVQSEMARAERDGRKLLIYVGATWCEPCVRFHDAVLAGQLDAELANVRFLELDHDQHEAILAQGDMDCRSKMIPLFAKPTPEGTCGPDRVEGAIKGDGAVGFLLPKVRALTSP